jgi:glutamyl-tRNA synthetase
MLAFLFVADDAFSIDETDRAKQLGDDGLQVVHAAASALDGLPRWDTPSIEEALRTALVDDLGLKPRNAFGPVRVAATGKRVSPPLFESLELLGRDRTLARLSAALA